MHYNHSLEENGQRPLISSSINEESTIKDDSSLSNIYLQHSFAFISILFWTVTITVSPIEFFMVAITIG